MLQRDYYSVTDKIALSHLEVISGIIKLLRLPANTVPFFPSISLSLTNVRKTYTIEAKMQLHASQRETETGFAPSTSVCRDLKRRGGNQIKLTVS